MKPRVKRVVAIISIVMISALAALFGLVLTASADTTTGSWGSFLSCTADSSGYCTVNHPAGTVPDDVVVTPTAASIMAVDNVTATTFRVRFFRSISSSGTVTSLPGIHSFYVHIDWAVSPSPSASLSPSMSASASASVSPSPSTSPSPSASSSSSAPPPPTGFPDVTNTGVPAGTSLTTVNGDMTVSTANTVVDGKDIHGCFEARALGIVLKNSKVHCGSLPVGSFDGVYSGAPLTVQDSEIDCLNTGGTAISEANITALRVNIHGCENGFDINQNITVQDSYIHDMYQSGVAHTDGIQLASAHLVNGAWVKGALNVKVVHNRIYANNGTSAMISNSGGDTNILVQNNLMAGGAYTLYCEQNSTGTNYRVIDNRISRIFYPNGGAYGPWTDCTDESVVTGNVWDDTNLPL